MYMYFKASYFANTIPPHADSRVRSDSIHVQRLPAELTCSTCTIIVNVHPVVEGLPGFQKKHVRISIFGGECISIPGYVIEGGLTSVWVHHFCGLATNVARIPL